MSEGFRELGLSEQSVLAIEGLGYERPTPVQAAAIPILLQGHDLVGQAQTGTGKTAAFGLPLVDLVDPSKPTPQALVLCPTRELATQVAEAIAQIGRSRSLRTTCVYGGQPIYRQIRALQAGVHVVVATPGRLQDHLRRGTLDPSLVKMVVLDEADEMLAMGFLEEVESILSQLPKERQVALFSATMPPQIRRLAQRHLRDPRTVAIDGGRQPVKLIRQSYYEVLPHQKVEALMRIFDMETPGPTIVFCRTRKGCDEVGERLAAQGFLADRLHGDLTQPDRDRVMDRFKKGVVDILVATDVAARGLDIETVTHVINFDVPWDAESYTHRIGRTGRAGREGDAILLLEPKERRHLHGIERATGNRIKLARIPTLADIKVRRSERLKEQLAQLTIAGGLELERALVESLGLDPIDIAAAALRLLAEAKPSREERMAEEDLNRAAPTEAGMVRISISVGRNQNIRPSDIVGAISNEAGIPGRRIGAIDIMDDSTFVEVPHESVDQIINALSRTRIRSKKVRVERQSPREARPRLGAVPGNWRERTQAPSEPSMTFGRPGEMPTRYPSASAAGSAHAGPASAPASMNAQAAPVTSSTPGSTQGAPVTTHVAPTATPGLPAAGPDATAPAAHASPAQVSHAAATSHSAPAASAAPSAPSTHMAVAKVGSEDSGAMSAPAVVTATASPAAPAMQPSSATSTFVESRPVANDAAPRTPQAIPAPAPQQVPAAQAPAAMAQPAQPAQPAAMAQAPQAALAPAAQATANPAQPARPEREPGHRRQDRPGERPGDRIAASAPNGARLPQSGGYEPQNRKQKAHPGDRHGDWKSRGPAQPAAATTDEEPAERQPGGKRPGRGPERPSRRIVPQGRPDQGPAKPHHARHGAPDRHPGKPGNRSDAPDRGPSKPHHARRDNPNPGKPHGPRPGAPDRGPSKPHHARHDANPNKPHGPQPGAPDRPAHKGPRPPTDDNRPQAPRHQRRKDKQRRKDA